MERVPVVALLFHSWPEGIIIGIAGLIFMGVKPAWGKAVIFGALHAITAYFLRQPELNTAVYLMLLIATDTIYLIVLYKLSLRKSLAAVILAIFLLIIYEGLVLSLLLQNTTLSIEVIMEPGNALLRVLVALPQMLLLALSGYIAYRVRGMDRQNYLKVYR